MKNAEYTETERLALQIRDEQKIANEKAQEWRIRAEAFGAAAYIVEQRAEHENARALKGTCDKAPTGWKCTRESGHDGPCAAVPV